MRLPAAAFAAANAIERRSTAESSRSGFNSHPPLLNVDRMTSLLILISAYFIIGASLKYVDLVSERFPKSLKAHAVAFGTSLLMAYLIFSDADSAAILFGVVAAVLITGKIDTPQFKLGAATAALGFFAFLTTNPFGAVNWFALLAITAAGVLDEFLSDYADKRRRRVLGLKSFLLKYRFSAKIAVLALVLVNTFHWAYFAAFLGLDVAYDLTGKALPAFSERNLLKNNLSHPSRLKAT